MMKDDSLMTKDEGSKLFRGFAELQMDGQTDKWMDIGDCRVSFVTKNVTSLFKIATKQYLSWLMMLI